MCGSGAAVVVGGGNSAGQAAIFLSGTTERVSLLLRGDDLGASMSSYLVEQIATIANIDVLTHTQVHALHGDTQLAAITIEDNRSGDRRDLDTAGLFVFIGADPCTDWLDDTVAKDEDGFLLTGADLGHPAMPLETSLPGVFAVGDTRSGSIKRVASAVGEGSMAVRLVHQHLAATRV
jgi:thioredoxin reductase (NADPH)